MVTQVIDFIFSMFTNLFNVVVSNWVLAFILLCSLISLVINLIILVRNK